jgi:hypothetical protein
MRCRHSTAAQFGSPDSAALGVRFPANASTASRCSCGSDLSSRMFFVTQLLPLQVGHFANTLPGSLLWHVGQTEQ